MILWVNQMWKCLSCHKSVTHCRIPHTRVPSDNFPQLICIELSRILNIHTALFNRQNTVNLVFLFISPHHVDVSSRPILTNACTQLQQGWDPVRSPVCAPLSICPWLYSPCGPWLLFQFLNLYAVSRTSWTGDEPVARPLPAHTTQT
jgi:hypothetical protein